MDNFPLYQVGSSTPHCSRGDCASRTGLESPCWCPDSWFTQPWSWTELIFTKEEEIHCSAWISLDFQTAPWWWEGREGLMASALMTTGWPTGSKPLMDSETGRVSQHWLCSGERSAPPKWFWALLKLASAESWPCCKSLEFWASQPRSCCFWGLSQGLAHHGWAGRLMCHSSLVPHSSSLHPV